MALRQPPVDLIPINFDARTPVTQWHTLDYTLVTPMYGGGVKAHTVDEAMPIRASAIRGQLRFWWRLLAEHQWKLGGLDTIRKAEFALWGGIDEKDPKASKVLIKVATTAKPSVQPWATYTPNHKGKLGLLAEKWADIPYALFPAQGKTEYGNITEQPHELAQVGLHWEMHVRFIKDKPLDPKKPDFDPNISETEESQVWEAIRWWSCFGGVGARTRRGLGAVQLLKSSEGVPPTLLKPITADEAKTAGCQLVHKQPVNDAYAAWKAAVEKLQAFRQTGELARRQRKPTPARSYWPEPDAIRRLTGIYLQSNEKNHRPEHQAGNIFPRAAFGLPIIFKFKDDSKNGDLKKDPGQLSLNPRFGENIGDRMASPIILRPVRVGERWAAGALLLPHAHVNRLNLALGTAGLAPAYYDPNQASHIPAIAQNGGGTPLQAFMTYFAQ